MPGSKSKFKSGRGGSRAGAGRPRRNTAENQKTRKPDCQIDATNCGNSGDSDAGSLEFLWHGDRVIGSIGTGAAARHSFYAAMSRVAKVFQANSAAEAIANLQSAANQGASEAFLDELADVASEEIFMRELVRLSIAVCEGKITSGMTVTGEKLAQTVSLSGLTF